MKAFLGRGKPFPGHVKGSIDAMEVTIGRVKAITRSVKTIPPHMETIAPRVGAFAKRVKAFLARMHARIARVEVFILGMEAFIAGKVLSLTRGNVFPEVVQGLCAGETNSTPGSIACMRADQSFTLPIQSFTRSILSLTRAILSFTRPNHAFISSRERFTRRYSTILFFLGAYLGVLGVLAARSMNRV